MTQKIRVPSPASLLKSPLKSTARNSSPQTNRVKRILIFLFFFVDAMMPQTENIIYKINYHFCVFQGKKIAIKANKYWTTVRKFLPSWKKCSSSLALSLSQLLWHDRYEKPLITKVADNLIDNISCLNHFFRQCNVAIRKCSKKKKIIIMLIYSTFVGGGLRWLFFFVWGRGELKFFCSSTKKKIKKLPSTTMRMQFQLQTEWIYRRKLKICKKKIKNEEMNGIFTCFRGLIN